MWTHFSKKGLVLIASDYTMGLEVTRLTVAHIVISKHNAVSDNLDT